MTAIQILEKIGSTASLKNHQGSGIDLSSLDIEDLGSQKIWCLMVPAEDDKDESSDEKDEEKKDENIIQ
ncbi:hypothetical protein P2G88_14225 [Aliiglaciecola sp. CAU 1673]|uniref:hypothetical protein n=1 Tax=Aliiglaciecola sp. CAU 1673 TaxID=3032595 RepID=UPI0023DC89F5|nr:hypothetical protein [Aliiglaciecola sp. CAU 1673]MDF2179408.1 hypothetical protein [Aliiglaciecola sp. CAU 1673]